jgi:hypothetical protein
MKHSSSFKIPFESQELDDLLTQWLSGTLQDHEKNEWKKVLLYDEKFRDDFCTWIKSLREPKISKSPIKQRRL